MAATSFLAIVGIAFVCASSRRIAQRYNRQIQKEWDRNFDEFLGGRKLGNYSLGALLWFAPIDLTPSRQIATSLLDQGSTMRRAIPPTSFHHPKYRTVRHLRNGGHGAVYRAIEEGNPDKDLVVKFVKSFEKEALYIVTGSNADRAGHRQALDALSKECVDLRYLQEHKKRNRVGASRMITCHARCFVGSRSCPTDARSPQFIVMEYGGIDGRRWLAEHRYDRDLIVIVLNQIREGLQYLSIDLKPPLSHHDLKWDNIVVRDNEDGSINVFFIDFGASLQISGHHKSNRDIVTKSTRTYSAPEWAWYAWFGPAHAFDAWALGIMALESLCRVSWSNCQRVEKRARQLLNRGKRSDTFEVDEGWLDEIGLDTPCALTLRHVLHPDPDRRLSPDKYIFGEEGLQQTSEIIHGGKESYPKPQNASLGCGSLLSDLQRQLDAATKSTQPTWQDVHTRGNLCMQDDRWSERKSVWPNALQAEHNMYSSDFHSVWKNLRNRVRNGVLSPLTRDDDKAFCACVWYNTIQRRELSSRQQEHMASTDHLRQVVRSSRRFLSRVGGSWADSVFPQSHEQEQIPETQQNEAIAGLALLQWAQAVRDLAKTRVTAGDDFAWGLLWSPASRDAFLHDRFVSVLEKVAAHAAHLFEVAGRAAVPSKTSQSITMISSNLHFNVYARYRLFYRRIYYLVKARLQAAAATMRCGVERALAGQVLGRNLFERGHAWMQELEQNLIGNTTAPSSSNLNQIIGVAENVRKTFIEHRSPPDVMVVPDFSTFDDTQLWDGWNDKVHLTQFAPRPTSSEQFDALWRRGCRSSPVNLTGQGTYARFRDHVMKNLEAGQQSLESIIEISSGTIASWSDGTLERSYVLGKKTSADVEKAGKLLQTYAINSGNITSRYYVDDQQNMEELRLSVLEKLSTRDGVIRAVFDLWDAVQEVRVHPEDVE